MARVVVMIMHMEPAGNTLLVEDDLKTARLIRAALEAEKYGVVAAHTGDRAIALLEQHSFDVIVLDWMLSGRTGIQIVEWLRKRGDRTPVLLLTARDAIADRVRGLDSGADDYLVKPFAIDELLARIRVLVRRGDDRATHRRVADLEVDSINRIVNRAGKRIALTPREFDLLWYLVRHTGKTVSRAAMARDLWNEPRRATPIDNVIDVHIAHLRRKIDDGHQAKLLHTVRGVGFTLRETNA
jgi:two-component system copper resistance phosphate regulon response regulator CusR